MPSRWARTPSSASITMPRKSSARSARPRCSATGPRWSSSPERDFGRQGVAVPLGPHVARPGPWGVVWKDRAAPKNQAETIHEHYPHLAPDEERKLVERAAWNGEDVTAQVHRLIERDITDV